MILETTFLVDFFRGSEQAVSKLMALEEEDVTVFTTSISVFEIMQGIRGEKEKTLAEKFFSSVQIIPFTKRSAFAAGEIRKKLGKSGITIEAEDAMIAGIAITRNKTILTRNIRHFSGIDGVKIESY